MKLEEVEAPEDSRDVTAEMVAAYQVAVTKAGELADALEGGDRQTIAGTASEYTTATDEAQAKARDLGLAECGRYGLPARN